MKNPPLKNEARCGFKSGLPFRAGCRGFSFVELLVAIAIAAAVLTVSVLAYQTITQSNNRLGNYGSVELPVGVMQNFYGLTGTFVRTHFAPNYSRAAVAEILRENFYEDLDYSSAVFCLAREGRSSIRPLTLPRAAGIDRRTLDTPEAFREFLIEADPASELVFTPYRGNATATNASIFMLMPSDSPTEFTVRAIYEIDLVPSANPVGTYASVRRYQGSTCTAFYDVFYPAPKLGSEMTQAFNPLVIAFEREARLNVTEGNDIDRFKVAANQPFYFVWWPDPTAFTLEAPTQAVAHTGTARDTYSGMANRTSFFLTFPMFPSL